jgi:hypothetical protein
MVARKKKEETYALNVPVAFGGVSIGEDTAKVSFSIERAAIDLERAEANLCGKRLTGKLVVCACGEDPNQKALPGMSDVKHELAATFDVKGFRCTPKLIASSASFMLSTIQVEELGHFAKKSGRLIVSEVEEVEEEEADEE